ncbi:23S rRNA (pseudouridine(1915)-N(3))-methyltransferase RlmH [Candidatus Riflebacteria bacterium]
MQNLIFLPGKPTGPINTLFQQYFKRLQHYGRFEVNFLKDPGYKAGGRQTLEQYLEKCSSEILKRLPENSYWIVLDEKGRRMNSSEFAFFFDSLKNRKRVCWILGGAYGLSFEMKKKADLLFSLSTMTLTHEIAFIILLEQIFRVQKKLRNEDYDK